MIVVHNLKGTSDNNVPNGYSSWRNWWECQKGRRFSDCSCEGCFEQATVGAHVQKDSILDRKWYIVPLCNSCNVSKTGISFNVRENDLQPVND